MGDLKDRYGKEWGHPYQIAIFNVMVALHTAHLLHPQQPKYQSVN
jgi:hypothetical protein